MSIGAAVSSLLTGTATDVYDAQLPENAALPAVSWEFHGAQHSRVWGADVGIVMATLDVNCYATTRAAVAQVADLVKAALNGYSGTAGGTTIELAALQDETDDHDPFSEPDASPGTGTYIRTLTFSVSYRS